MLRETMIKQGKIRGLPAADPRITVYKGIPYAAPPTGPLRWKAPVRALPWEGTFHAYHFGPIAMQEKPGLDPDNIYSREWHVDPDLPMSEDCLYLNIWTPAKEPGEKLPVMVWFFGGGLNGGYPQEMEFDGERIARRNVVMVSVNYRVNVFGLLAHPELTQEGAQDGCITNFALYDQRFSLFWVKENIEAFGGDPGNITIFGQSGGGRSVLFQTLCPQNPPGLFHKAISMSGSGITVDFIQYQNLKEAEESGRAFFDILGVKTLEEARQIPAEEIERISLANPKFRWGAVVDGYFLTDQPARLLFQGKRLPVPILAGHTSTEMWDFFNDADTEEKFEKKARRLLHASADQFLNLCEFDKGDFKKTRSLASINHQRLCVELLARKSLDTGAPFYFYCFSPEIPGWDHPGVFHSSDLWFAFETLAKSWRPFTGKHYDLARIMCNYWTNFARKGDPNGEDCDGSYMPLWLPYTEQTPWSMNLGDKIYMDCREESEAVRFLMDHIVC